MEAVNAFLLGFPALFSIVNPISGAFIFRSVTSDRPPEVRARLAKLVALNSFGVMMVALWAGSFVLAFFGITLAALRVAGGLVVALSGWRLLNAPETHEERKQQQAASAEGVEDIALFPLTIHTLYHGSGYDVRGSRARRWPSQAVRWPGLVFPGDERGSTGDDRNDLACIPVC